MSENEKQIIELKHIGHKIESQYFEAAEKVAENWLEKIVN